MDSYSFTLSRSDLPVPVRIRNIEAETDLMALRDARLWLLAEAEYENETSPTVSVARQSQNGGDPEALGAWTFEWGNARWTPEE